MFYDTTHTNGPTHWQNLFFYATELQNDANQNAKSTARATIDALVASGTYEEVGAAKAQQIDFSGVLTSAGTGTLITLTLPTTAENAGGNVSVFASATTSAIVLARQFTDALIENDLAEEVPAFKKTLTNKSLLKKKQYQMN